MVIDKSFFSTKAAAEKLELTEARIRQLCLEGSLEGAWKFSERAWLIPARGVRKFVSSRKTASKKKLLEQRQKARELKKKEKERLARHGAT